MQNTYTWENFKIRILTSKIVSVRVHSFNWPQIRIGQGHSGRHLLQTMASAFAPSSVSSLLINHGKRSPNLQERRGSCGRRAVSAVYPLHASHSVDFTSRSEASARNIVRQLVVRDASPVTLGRRNVSQDFAVTLMRAGYSATDELDIIAMQDFQKRFFETRQLEWQVYLQKNNSVRQGLLTDPSYFDFISFAQMLTIHNAISAPSAIFEEQFQDSSGTFRTRVVRRDVAALPDASAIYAAWQRMVGTRILDAFSESFGASWATRVEGNDASLSEIRTALCEIYSHFTRNGYCLDAHWNFERASNDERRDFLGSVELVAPCILWGNRTLRRRRCIPNDYDCFVASAALQSRFSLSCDCETTYTPTSIVRFWRICS